MRTLRFHGDTKLAESHLHEAEQFLHALKLRGGELPLLSDFKELPDGSTIRIISQRDRGVDIISITSPPMKPVEGKEEEVIIAHIFFGPCYMRVGQYGYEDSDERVLQHVYALSVLEDGTFDMIPSQVRVTMLGRDEISFNWLTISDREHKKHVNVANGFGVPGADMQRFGLYELIDGVGPVHYGTTWKIKPTGFTPGDVDLAIEPEVIKVDALTPGVEAYGRRNFDYTTDEQGDSTLLWHIAGVAKEEVEPYSEINFMRYYMIYNDGQPQEGPTVFYDKRNDTNPPGLKADWYVVYAVKGKGENDVIYAEWTWESPTASAQGSYGPTSEQFWPSDAQYHIYKRRVVELVSDDPPCQGSSGYPIQSMVGRSYYTTYYASSWTTSQNKQWSTFHFGGDALFSGVITWEFRSDVYGAKSTAVCYYGEYTAFGKTGWFRKVPLVGVIYDPYCAGAHDEVYQDNHLQTCPVSAEGYFSFGESNVGVGQCTSEIWSGGIADCHPDLSGGGCGHCRCKYPDDYPWYGEEIAYYATCVGFYNWESWMSYGSGTRSEEWEYNNFMTWNGHDAYSRQTSDMIGEDMGAMQNYDHLEGTDGFIVFWTTIEYNRHEEKWAALILPGKYPWVLFIYDYWTHTHYWMAHRLPGGSITKKYLGTQTSRYYLRRDLNEPLYISSHGQTEEYIEDLQTDVTGDAITGTSCQCSPPLYAWAYRKGSNRHVDVMAVDVEGVPTGYTQEWLHTDILLETPSLSASALQDGTINPVHGEGTYSYVVVSRNALGCSLPSNPRSVFVALRPIKITIHPVEGATEHILYRKGPNQEDHHFIAKVLSNEYIDAVASGGGAKPPEYGRVFRAPIGIDLNPVFLGG